MTSVITAPDVSIKGLQDLLDAVSLMRLDCRPASLHMNRVLPLGHRANHVA